MSEKSKARERLIDDTLNEGWDSGPAAAFARRAAAQVRRRRRRQQALLGAGTLVGVVLAAFLATRPVSPASVGPRVAPAKPAYEVITDEQLLAAWGDRPILILPNERPERRLVLLSR